MNPNKFHPYPGLRAFERSESRLFFGRQQQVFDILERLKSRHFLAVLGTSGSGKSSLMKAGVLPSLAKGYMGEIGARWSIAEMKPGDQPFVRLAEALLDDPIFKQAWNPNGDRVTASLTAELRGGWRSLHEILQHHPLPEGTKLLLLVDQFEELFRFRMQAEDQAAAFVALLLEACTHPDIYVAITMRSDFLGAAAEFHNLPEMINDGLYLTPRLTRDQLREAIATPALQFDGEVEEALINHLLNEAGNDPDQLPLLQHALMRLWENDEDKILTLEEFQAMGSLSGALDGHAELAWNELDTEQKRIAEILFRALTERRLDGQDIRRPISVGALLALAQCEFPQLVTVIDTFRQAGRNFLMPPPSVVLTPDTVLDISHESLIRQWKRLQAWVVVEREQASMYWRLLDASQRHRDGQSELWRGTDLILALEWQSENAPTAAWAARYGSHEDFALAIDFLHRSDAEAKRLKQELAALAQEVENNRKAELKRTRRRMKLSFMGFLIALGLAGWGFNERTHAEREAAKAERAMQNAISLINAILNDKKMPSFSKSLSDRVEKIYTDAIVSANEDSLDLTNEVANYFDIANYKVPYYLGGYAVAIQKIHKDYPRAKKLYEDAIAADPDNAENLLNFALFLENEIKDNDSAEKFYERAIVAAPSNIEAHLHFGVFMMDIRKNIPRAQEIFEQAIVINPNKEDGFYFLAILLQGRGARQNDRAEKLFEQAFAIAPTEPIILTDYAAFLSRYRQDYSRAEKFYEQALALDLSNANNYQQFGRFVEKRLNDPVRAANLYLRAEKLYEQSILTTPNDASKIQNFAWFMARDRKDCRRTEKLIEQVIEIEPTSVRLSDDGFVMRTFCQHYDQAEKYYLRAIEISPKDAYPLNSFAIFTMTNRKDYTRAETLFQQAIAVEPQNSAYLGNYAQLKLIQGKFKEGKLLIDKSFAATPSNTTKLRLSFYRLAHFPQDYPQAEKEILALLKNGARSEYWDFSPTISRAEKDGHPNVKLLKVLAKVMNDNAKFETLNPYIKP